MIDFFHTIIYQPLFNLLIFFYNVIPFADLGVAVILLTLLVKGILFPLGLKAARSQKEMENIQPEVKEIQEKYKENKEEQAKKIMELYKERKVNPFSGILILIVQLPILISLFHIFWRGIGSEEMVKLYDFVSAPEVVNNTFLGIVDLSSPNAIIALIAAGGQYFQMKMIVGGRKEEEKKGKKKKKKKKETDSKADMMKSIQTQMVYFLPGFTFFILLTIPSAVGFYWIITVMVGILQHYIVKKKIK